MTSSPTERLVFAIECLQGKWQPIGYWSYRSNEQRAAEEIEAAVRDIVLDVLRDLAVVEG